jgi:hypothetical protein
MPSRQYAFWSQFVFMFAFTKVVKLMGLFRRNPSDIIFLPLSIVFGYFHGFIKLYALLTLNMVCILRVPHSEYPQFTNHGICQTSWGSREDGDTNDESRLAPAPQPSIVLKTPPGKASLIRYNIRQKGRQVHSREHDTCREKEAYAAYDSSTSYIPSGVPEDAAN